MKRTSVKDVINKAAELPMKLGVVVLHPSQRNAGPYVLVEGDKASLTLLGKLIVAIANGDTCGFDMGPKGAGNLYFTEYSELGIYVHRLPCDYEEAGKKPMSAADVASKNTKRKKPFARKTTPRKRASRGG